MNRKTELAKNTAILAFGKICTQCISFLLLPLYTAVLDTTEYGTFDLMVTYGTLLIPLVNWQFDQGIFRFTLDCRDDVEQQKKLFSTVLAFNTLHILVYIALLAIGSRIITISNSYFLMAYVALHVYTALFLQFVRGLGKNKAYAVASFISASMTVVLNVITLVCFDMGLNGLFYATLLSQVFTILYLCIKIRPHKYFSLRAIKKDVYTSVRRYSLPLIPNNLAWWVVNVSDRTVISYFLGVAVNGLYTVANKFSNVFIQIYNVFNLSWTETVSLHYNDEDRDEFLSETITTMYGLFSCACLGIVACMPFIFPIMVNKDYSEAYPQIIILMYAMLCRVVVGLYSSTYVATKESKKIASTSIISAVINIAVNLALIGKIGLFAASISTLVAFGIMAVVRYIDINKVIRLRIDAKILISSILLALLLAVTYYVNHFVLNIIMLVIICVYAIIVNKGFIRSAVDIGKKFLKK